VFEETSLRKSSDLKEEQYTLEIDKLHNLLTSSDIIKVIETRWIRRAGHVARMEK
jgi:hypothetical protein